MPSYIQPRHLLALAEREAGIGAGPGRPISAELRRSVSSAYYAVFHALSMHAAMELIDHESRTWTQDHARVCRWIAHQDLKKLAEAVVSGPGGNQPLADVIGAAGSRLERLAQNFIDLQTARHAADYDDFAQVSRALSLAWVAAARGSLETSMELWTDRERSYVRFLRLGLGAVKIAKSR